LIARIKSLYSIGYSFLCSDTRVKSSAINRIGDSCDAEQCGIVQHIISYILSLLKRRSPIQNCFNEPWINFLYSIGDLFYSDAEQLFNSIVDNIFLDSITKNLEAF